jgi:hypothetical protein
MYFYIRFLSFCQGLDSMLYVKGRKYPIYIHTLTLALRWSLSLFDELFIKLVECLIFGLNKYLVDLLII